jgi:hypothetical protein
MSGRQVWFGLLGLAIHSTFSVGSAFADRRTGLAGNILIEDPDDLFPFPQYTLLHRNMFRLDYGASSASGNGVLTLGNDAEALGIAVHRGDILSPDIVGFNQELAWRSGVGNPFGSTSFATFTAPDGLPGEGEVVLPATVMDLSYARALGRNAIGARLGFGRGVQAVRVDGDGVSKGAQTFFGAQLGYSSLPPDGLRYDLSANVVFAFGKVVLADVDENSGWNLRVGALGRAYYPINRIVDVGFLGNVSIENENTNDDSVDDDSNALDFGIMAGVGPVIRLDRAKIASYVGLRMGVGKTSPGDDGDDVNRLRFAAPMVNMAAEVQLLDWLYVRTGAEYNWQLSRDATDTTKQRVADGAFRWAAGLGAQKDSFYFDGVVQNDFVTGGPDFIGGNANGFLAIASFTYKFGDVFGTAGRPISAPSTPAASSPAVDRPVPAAPPPAPAPVVTPREDDPELGSTVPDTDVRGNTRTGAAASGSVNVNRR